ncbi:MAG: SCO family protein [bacterium]|nr:SCO family protein [bacterium]
MLFSAQGGLAYAQLLSEDLPANARGISVEDKIGEFIPLDCIFEDERGNKIGLGKYFNQGKTVVLTLNYSDCPGLCIAQLDNLVGTLKAMNAKGLGSSYEIVTVSIDPREDHIKAAGTKSKYLGMLQSRGGDEYWHFLTGKQSEITKLAQAVGFRYTYDRANQRYNHPAATFFISPKGRICRYLLSLGVEPQQFQLAVAEASDGILADSISDAIVQFCYLYDPDANRYSADARRMLAFAAGAFALLLLGTTAPFWFSRRSPKVGESSGVGDGQITEGLEGGFASDLGEPLQEVASGSDCGRESRADAAKQPTPTG